MQSSRSIVSAALGCALVTLPWAGAAAPSLEAYGLSAAGQSNFGIAGCSTFAPDPAAAGMGGIFDVGLPTGVGCGVGVDRHTDAGTAGQAVAGSTLAVGFGSSADPRTFTGSSQGRGGFGNLGVSAQASYTGAIDSSTVIGAQAFGRQTETMTFGGAVGAGRFRPTFTVDGSFFSAGSASSQLAFFYRAGTAPNLLGFRIQDVGGALSLYGPDGYVDSLDGMPVTGNAATGITVAGSTTFALDFPIVFGTPADFTYTLWAAVLPSTTGGSWPSPSEGNLAFLGTVRMTGIEIIGPGGQPLNDFTVTAGSGTGYGSRGVIAVPEPGTWLLMAGGLAGLLLRRTGAVSPSAARG